MFSVVALTSYRLIENESTRAAQFMLHGTISDIERPLTELEVQTKTIATHILMQVKDTNALNMISYNTVSMSKIISGLAIIIPPSDSRGEVVIYSFSDTDNVIQRRRVYDMGLLQSSWLQSVISSRQPSWTVPYYAEHRGGKQSNRVTTYCYPLYDNDSSLVAMVCADLTLEWLEHLVANIRPYENSITAISCSEDVVIGIDDSLLLSQIKKSFSENKELQALGEDMRMGVDSIRRRVGKGRSMFFVAYGPLHNGWILSISCLYRDVMKKTSTMNLILIILGLLGLVLIFFGCTLTIKKMTRPITELSDAALNMAKGNFDAHMPAIKSQDEMKSLRDSFVYMQNSIVEYIDELKTTTRENERMESELNVARNIQMGMLRSDFSERIHALLVPAKEVGGDLYDYAVKDSKLYFAIGDVSGKGVPASLMMVITRAAVRFIEGLDMPLDQSLCRINDGVSESNSNDMFVTLLVARVDLVTGHMEFCNAGHNPLVIIPPDGNPYFLNAKPNIAVGLFPSFNFESECIDLKPGTRIVAYTDGVCEAEREDNSQYGNDRLLAWASDNKTRSLATTNKEVVDSLYASVTQFANGNPQNDDITIMSIIV